MRQNKDIAKQVDGYKLYGIEIKHSASLQDVKEIWSHRTIDTYTLLPPITSIETSLWRSIRSGKLVLWNDTMISSVNKKNTSVVDSYIYVDSLNSIDFFRLSLEYLTTKSTELIKHSIKSKVEPHEIVKDIYDEITVSIKLEKRESSLNAVRYYQYLQDTIKYLRQNSQIDSEEAQYIKDLGERSRFWELNDKLQYSDWAASCLAIHEIENSELFRFEYKSLREYVAQGNTLEINYDEYLRRSKAGSVVKFLSQSSKRLPSNKSQAIALGEIPLENMLVVWDKFLENPGRKSVKLIGKIHEEILFGEKEEVETNNELDSIKADIIAIIESDTLCHSIKTMFNVILSQDTISPLEVKIVKMIKSKTRKSKN